MYDFLITSIFTVHQHFVVSFNSPSVFDNHASFIFSFILFCLFKCTMLMAVLINHVVVILDLSYMYFEYVFQFIVFLNKVLFLSKLIAHDLYNFSHEGKVPFCINTTTTTTYLV